MFADFCTPFVGAVCKEWVEMKKKKVKYSIFMGLEPWLVQILIADWFEITAYNLIGFWWFETIQLWPLFFYFGKTTLNDEMKKMVFSVVTLAKKTHTFKMQNSWIHFILYIFLFKYIFTYWMNSKSHLFFGGESLYLNSFLPFVKPDSLLWVISA